MKFNSNANFQVIDDYRWACYLLIGFFLKQTVYSTFMKELVPGGSIDYHKHSGTLEPTMKQVCSSMISCLALYGVVTLIKMIVFIIQER